jgi:hypothetical protein
MDAHRSTQRFDETVNSMSHMMDTCSSSIVHYMAAISEWGAN